MELVGFGIGNYRSIGMPAVEIDLRKRLHFLIGPNDCGKTNVLRAIEWLRHARSPQNGLQDLDFHQCDLKSEVQVTLKARIGPSALPGYKPGDVVEFRLALGKNTRSLASNSFTELPPKIVALLVRELTGTGFGGALGREQAAREADKLANRQVDTLLAGLPPVTLVPQYREITNDVNYTIDGQG